MRLDLALIGAFAALSLVIAVLTHRHIVRPLEHLEAVASKVRETKDYGLRVLYDGKDEIGRVTAAFNDMLAELAAARKRETAERAELARVTRLTTMGEMAASIAHEVNQPLAAIVTNANAGLRWLAHPTPDLTKVDAVLQRVVRDGHRASEVIGSVRAMFKRDVQEKRRSPSTRSSRRPWRSCRASSRASGSPCKWSWPMGHPACWPTGCNCSRSC